MKLTSIVFILLTVTTQFLAQELNVERIWKNYEFSAKRAGSYQAMNDGLHYVEMSQNGDIVSGLIAAGSTSQNEIIVPKSALVYNDNPIAIAGFELNANEQKVLLWTAPQPIYRRSFEAFYFLYDLKSKKLEALDAAHSPQTLAEYSPDGKMVSFIHGNDLFVKDLTSGKTQKITQDGKRNKVINGTTDWVYEEEFAIRKHTVGLLIVDFWPF